MRALPLLSQTIPLVITLHDAWLLSGHCAHSLGCERWKTGCGHCPDLALPPGIRRDSTAYNWKRKRNIYQGSRLHIITPSQWLMDKVQQSILTAGIISAKVIPNGVDLSIFHKSYPDKASLGLPYDENILLFSADGIRKNVYKDYQTLKLAIQKLADKNRKITFVALGEAGSDEYVGNAKINFLSYKKDPEKVAQYYQAADIYIHASKADTFPTSVIEALACGTPVVATSVGGIPEQIIDGKTGFLTPEGDPHGMSEKLEQLLDDKELRKRMGQAAEQDARERFDLNDQVDEYLSWYQEILEESKPDRV